MWGPGMEILGGSHVEAGCDPYHASAQSRDRPNLRPWALFTRPTIQGRHPTEGRFLSLLSLETAVQKGKLRPRGAEAKTHGMPVLQPSFPYTARETDAHNQKAAPLDAL